MSTLVYVLSLFLSLVYCDKMVHTNPGTTVDVVKECSELIEKDVKIRYIDPLITKYKDKSDLLIQAIDSQLADPKISKQLKGIGDVYHSCTNEGYDADNQRTLKIFNECSDTLLNYRDELVSAIGKDASHILTAIEAELGRVSEKNAAAKSRVCSFNSCVHEKEK